MLSPADINECEGNAAGCEHNCENTAGDYHCTCDSGHTLTTDLHNCLGKLLVCQIHCHSGVKLHVNRKHTCSHNKYKFIVSRMGLLMLSPSANALIP